MTFPNSSAEITPEDRLLLDSIAHILAKRPAFDVEVRGHTDSTWQDAYNRDLSQHRA